MRLLVRLLVRLLEGNRVHDLLRGADLDAVFLQRDEDAAVELAAHRELLQRRGDDPDADRDARMRERLDAQDLRPLGDERVPLGIVVEFVGDAANDLERAVDLVLSGIV